MTDLAFGSFRLRRQERLLKGPDGPVELSARAFDLLVVLLEHPGEVVSKDALFAAVWPSVVVEENTLQVHISALRKALPSGMIATAHGRGYRYAGPAPERSAAAAQPGNSHRGPLIVVLPFANLGGDPDQQYFSDGIAQDITDRLARFRELTVIGLDRLALGANPAPDADWLRQTIGADFIVSGSIRRSDDRIRVAARLTDTETRAAIWAEQFDRPLADLFDLQDEVSGRVAGTIARRLEVELTSRSIRRAPSSLKAYDLTLRGIWYNSAYTRDDMARAIACCEQALAEEPVYPEALGWLGVAMCTGYDYDFELEKTRRGLALIEKASKLDPANSLPFVSLSVFGGVLYGADASRTAVDRALRLNPGDYYAHAQRALVSIYDGDLALARSWLDSVDRLTPNPLPWVAQYETLIAFHEGRFREACSGFEPFADQAWHMMYAIAAHGHLGERDQAQAIVARFAAEGRVHDYLAAAAREPYLHAEPRERLIEGVRLALG